MSVRGPSRYRSFKRFLKVSGGLATVATLTTLAMPKELLPQWWLPFRVLLEGIGRLFRCCIVGGQVMYDYKVSLAADADQAAWDAVHLRSAHRLVALAERNGGLYVKTGQGFGLLNHMLPPQYCKTMVTLQDAVLKRPYVEIEAVIQEDLGQLPTAVFKSFDDTPIAAASIAQVHKAVLHDGRAVAVKVQYIDIGQRFHGDMATIRLMLGISGALFRGFDFGPIVKRTQEIMSAELDFVNEAENSELCKKHLHAEFGDRVTTPTLVKEYCTSRVLVSEFVDGVKMNDRKGMEARHIDVREAARLCYAGLAHQLFCTGFVHADPHPGNIFVRKNQRGQCQIVILDHGLYVTMTDAQRVNLAELWTAITTHHDADLEKVCAKLGVRDFKLLASMFIQHPYDYFSASKARMDPADLDLIRRHSREKMDEVNEILEVLPKEYAMVLRNISAVRATSKDLGNPVSRPAAMLRYSLRTSHAGAGSALYVWKCLFEQWWQELKARAVTAFIAWRYPDLNEALDDMLTMG